MEQAWQGDDVLALGFHGKRYGVVIQMPWYWGLPVSVALTSAGYDDDPVAVAGDRRELVFHLHCAATQVKLGPVRPYNPRLLVNVDGVTESGR